MVNYGPIVYWCRSGEKRTEGWGPHQRSFRQGWTQMGRRICAKAPLTTHSRFCALGADRIGCQRVPVKRPPKLTVWPHSEKLDTNHLVGTNTHQTRPQAPNEDGSLNHSSKMFPDRILLGNPRSQPTMTIALSLDRPRPGWDAQWSDLG